MPDTEAFRLNELFGAISDSVVLQQQRLDADYLRDLDAFQQCFREAGYSPLASQFIPARQVVQQALVQCALGVRQTKEKSFSIRLVNRVYASRYMYSQSFDTKVQVAVQRVPLPITGKNS
jgi:hypothetical protein